MNRILLLFSFAFIFCAVKAQQVITLDPEKDTIARKGPNGFPQISVPLKVLAVSIRETLPQLGPVQSVSIQQMGKSYYLQVFTAATGPESAPGAIAILLVETAAGAFQTDRLIISCDGSNECRECKAPPLCGCNKGDGVCNLNSSWMSPLKKVTVTVFD